MLGLDGLLKLINNLINSDIKNLNSLRDLQNTELHIEISDLKIHKVIYFYQSQLSLDRDLEKVFSPIHIQGDLTSYLTLLISKDPKRAVQHGLMVDGEVKALQSLEHFLLNLTVDWQTLLLSYANDTAKYDPKLSYLFIHTLKQVVSSITEVISDQNRLDTLSIMVSDYIQDEKNWVPVSGEIKNFIQAADDIRSAVERCEARVNALILNASKRAFIV